MIRLKNVIRVFIGTFVFLALCSSVNAAEKTQLKKSKDCERIKAKIVRKIVLPRGYHEGLYFDGSAMWVLNGTGLKTWVVDIASGQVVSTIEPIASFSEGMTSIGYGKYFMTDWSKKNLYRASVIGNKVVAESQVSLAPGLPAGVLWTGSRLFVITWTRGFGTKYSLLEMDKDMNVIDRIDIQKIEEPAHMTWDGKNLWITSWYSQKVYKIDIDSWKIVGVLQSPVPKATGIAWDGAYLWITGTYSDLYKLEIGKKEAPVTIMVKSSAFKSGEMIPKKYTGDGEEVSPPLEWSGIPAGTKSIALISDDPDAPAGTWVHWVIFNIPADVKSLPEDVPHAPTLDNGARQGMDDSGNNGYGGPCPPSGTHRYYFKIYALDSMLDLKPGIRKKDLLKAMEGHILAQGELMGKYKR